MIAITLPNTGVLVINLEPHDEEEEEIVIQSTRASRSIRGGGVKIRL